MQQKLGKWSLRFTEAPFILESSSVVGTKEADGPLGGLFDIVGKDDRFGQNTWEKAESSMQRDALTMALGKAHLDASDMDYVFAGDLLGQSMATTFGVENFRIPWFGVYGACSTCGESLSLAQGCLGFENASIITPRSNVNFPFVSLAGDSWAQYKDFIGEVRIDASMRNTTVSTDDIAFFAPKLRDWHVDFTDVNVEVAGVVSDFTGRIRSMQIGEGTTLVADASVKGLPDIRKTRFDLSVPRLRSTARAVDELALGIAGRKLSDKLVGVLGNSGQIDLNARFRGLLSSFDMQLGAATGVGNVSCNLKMAPVKGGLSSVRGDVETRNLRLGELLDRRDLLGNATLTAYVDGVIGRGVADANVVGNVTQLGFNGYVYDSLRLDGRLRNREFDGRITARDPNLDFDFFGTVDLNDSVPRYDFTMDLRHADLARLHVNRRDSVSQLSGRIVAAAGGRSLDDLNGRIQVTDARYRYNDKEIAAASMTVTGENSERSKFVELRSDFADVTFRSKTSYRTVFEYLRRSAWKYLPMLGGEKWEETPSERKAAVANDFSLLSVNIRNFNPVADAVSTGLQIADGSSLQLLFNPASDQLSLKAASEYIERRRMLATRLSVNASNRGDSLAVYASAEDLYAGVLHLPRLSLTGGARQNRVQLSAGFDDTLRRVSGLVGFRAAVADEHGPNGRVVDLRILPRTSPAATRRGRFSPAKSCSTPRRS